MAFQTPEKQILPIAPITDDTMKLARWAGDLTRTLQQNLATIARRANDKTTVPLSGDLDAAGFDIINVGELEADIGTFNTSLTVGGVAVVPANYQPIDADLTSWAGVTRAAGFDTFVAAASSANFASLLTDETGTGVVVFSISPALTGTPTAPTAAPGTNTTQLATTSFVATSFAPLASPTITGIPVFSGIPSLTGGALTFPATQVPSAGANDLDDYEEGTFTPAFSATGSTFSYSQQSGAYTKIGRMVFFDIQLSLDTTGNTLTANSLSVTGLPFTSAGGAGFFPLRWTSSTTSYVLLGARVSGTTLVIEGATAAATASSTQALANGVLHATAGSLVRVIGNYFV
jgi:hypothetical protein